MIESFCELEGRLSDTSLMEDELPSGCTLELDS